MEIRLAQLRGILCGKGLGDYVVRPVETAKRITVVSPRLSRGSAELLVKKKMDGVEVRLVTTLDRPAYHVEALRSLLGYEHILVDPGKPKLDITLFFSQEIR
ncbi:hypothetical protein [Desulfurococcus amylolyticus]|uniref:Uncharacterized protein n=1 Tax=Desulfurococcus amylolyticus DSM 16532 TaxID=768672 RepID=I3XQX1_DESAM|nr:hypothetical protein [Desulfurococcus amylolyticus]AFL66345.1 hypothetical protein Desfe_0436 [Desulfurococcus amylolyticus DSM 16532]